MRPRPPGAAGVCAFTGSCGSHRVWRTDQGVPDQTCVYDASGQHLLSAKACGVDLSFCDNTAICNVGGEDIDIDQECDVPLLPEACPAASD